LGVPQCCDPQSTGDADRYGDDSESRGSSTPAGTIIFQDATTNTQLEAATLHNGSASLSGGDFQD
jgi:hypothetical protein